MTPVEERIDHEELLALARDVIARKRQQAEYLSPFQEKLVYESDTWRLARAVEALLTEHSAREEREKVLRKSLRDIERTKWWSASQARSHATKALAALPATESAQPEEER